MTHDNFLHLITDVADTTGYTKEQREEMTANKTAEIYEELKVKCGFRW